MKQKSTPSEFVLKLAEGASLCFDVVLAFHQMEG